MKEITIFLSNKYLQNSQSGFLSIFSGRFIVESSAFITDTRNIELQLTGDAFLDVDDPQGLSSSGFDSGDLTGFRAPFGDSGSGKITLKSFVEYVIFSCWFWIFLCTYLDAFFFKQQEKKSWLFYEANIFWLKSFKIKKR